MKRDDLERAVRATVNGLYSGANADMEEALWEVLEVLDPDVAALMQEDEESAHAKVNFEPASDEDDDRETLSETFLDERYEDE